MSDVPVLEVSGLCVDYVLDRGDVRAVDDVSFTLNRGEFLGVVGESGCGKSTLLFASSLQFIGLGDPNTVSWGTTLYWAQNNAALQTGEPLWAIAPGACIAVLGAAFALLNYAFDEIGNPALRPVRKVRHKRGATPRV